MIVCFWRKKKDKIKKETPISERIPPVYYITRGNTNVRNHCVETTRSTTSPAVFRNRAGLGYTIRVISLRRHVALEVDPPYLICTYTGMLVRNFFLPYHFA